MIFITLSSQCEANLAYSNKKIDWVGYSFNASPQELWEHNLGVWKLGKRALDESYVAFIYNGVVRLVASISSIKPYEDSGRYYFEGEPLASGNFVYDKWIGKEVKGTRNPIRYFEDTEVDGWSIAKDQEIQSYLSKLKEKHPKRSEFITSLKNTIDHQ